MKKLQFLSNSNLKLIALISMAIDHFGYTIVYYQWNQYYPLCRMIGRIAFPIFCFLLVEGFVHTSNRRHYAGLLLLFAIISEIPFDLAFNINRNIWFSQNVFFTLLLGLLVIWAMETFTSRPWLQLLALAAGMLLAYLIRSDYDFWGVLLIAVFYYFYRSAAAKTIAGIICLLLGSINLPWEWISIFALIPINFYNGKRGWVRKKAAKYAFYIFYPAHLLLLFAIRYFWITPALPLLP